MKKVFWGLFFILAAAFLILNSIFLEINFSLFHVLALIILVPLLIDSLYRLNFAGAMFPLAFLVMIFKEYLQMGAVSNWTIFFAAILSSIGLGILFGKKKIKKYVKYKGPHKKAIIERGDESNLFFDVSFGSGIRYVDSEDFKSATLDCSFASMKVYFDQAIMTGESATVTIDASFSGVELYFPKEWEIINNLEISLAGVDMDRSCASANKTKKLYLNGEVSLGEVEIHCI